MSSYIKNWQLPSEEQCNRLFQHFEEHKTFASAVKKDDVPEVSNSKSRKSPSIPQLDTMFKALQANKPFAKALLPQSSMVAEWKALATMLNGIQPGMQLSWKEWSALWKEYRTRGETLLQNYFDYEPSALGKKNDIIFRILM